jgi:predicted ATPase/signal transduction histidine kinase
MQIGISSTLAPGDEIEMGDGPTYTITEALSAPSTGSPHTHRSHAYRAHVYRARRGPERRPVIIKMLAPHYSPQHLDRFETEFEIGSLLDLESVVRPIDRVSFQSRPALVFDDFGGQALSAHLGAPMEIGRFLRLALSITDAVADLHQHSVVHRDLKPDNILIHPETEAVKISDFGIASILSGQRQPPGGVRLIEGSLPYMSPEQTGRTNRVLDQRSDLYSLGITFFEMLTGQLPFAAQDPVEWVHCHIAIRPPAPSALVTSIPPGLSALVMKLLTKEAEERYQSARGLRHDLRIALEQWSRGGRIDPFPLGQHDVADRFQIPQKLYGREAETTALLAGFERVLQTGTPEVVLISGYSGIGKSALVHELQKPIVRQRGLFAEGKFDQYKRDIPYSIIVHACNELVLEILAESESRIAVWRRRLREALGPNGQLIVDVLPQVELIIGAQPPVPALPPAESQNRFRLVFRRFITVFARKQQPLVLFLDDLQWADSASLALLSDLTNPAGGAACHLFVIGAFRDNEVGPTHPLTLMLAEVRRRGARVSDIVLGPLPRPEIAAFISDVFHCRLAHAEPLANLIDEKTGGNPFFTIQFLSSLSEERLVDFDAAAGAWRWDIARIRAKGFTDNIVDFMLEKLLRLPPTAQQALKLLACLGIAADDLAIASTLAAMLGPAAGRGVHAIFSPALRAGLVVRVGGGLRFMHDRVQEAAYSLIPPATRAEVHLCIGRMLVAKLSRAQVDERVFDVVNQLNRGVDLIVEREEKDVLFRLNLLAGTRAKASAAHAAARTYLGQAAALLPDDAWTERYDETFALHYARGQCDYLLGNFAATEELCRLLFEHARPGADHCQVASLRVRLFQNSGRFAESVEIAVAAFAQLGITCPQDDTQLQAAIGAEIAAIPANLRGRAVADLVDAPVATAPELAATLNLLIDYTPGAFNTGAKSFPFMILRCLNLCLQQGNTPEACYAYSAATIIMAAMLGDRQMAFEFSTMSLALNEKLDGRRLRGTLLVLHAGFVNFWRRPFATGLPIMERAVSAALEVGDFVFAASSGAHTFWQAFEKGDPVASVLAFSEKHEGICRQVHDDLTALLMRQAQQFMRCLQGKTTGPDSFDAPADAPADAAFDEAACLALFAKAGATSGLFINHLLHEVINLIYDRPALALASATSAQGVVLANMGTALEAGHHFFHGLILAAAIPDASAAQQAPLTQLLTDKVRKLKAWAESCPENFLCRLQLLLAEQARVAGRDLEAMRLYEHAIRSANENGFVQIEALANDLAARFYRARGFHSIADGFLLRARDGYARWGADGKVAQLDARYPHLRAPRSLVSDRVSGTDHAATLTFRGSAEQLDLLSIIKASQAISGEIEFDQLLRRLMHVLIGQGGAERAYVVLRRNRDIAEDLAIEAEAFVDQTGSLQVNLLGSIAARASRLLPTSIINYVWRTKARVLLDNAADGGRFASDVYLTDHEPRSILCLPIVHQGEALGLFYLENNQVAGAFRIDQVELLELLASQTAISLDHALLLAQEKAARLQAVEALRLREEFLTVASHELRTPMTSLTLTLQTLQGHANPRGGRPPLSDGSGIVDLACRQALRMNRLINELLEVSRIQSGRMPLDLIELDLVALVCDAVKRFTPDCVQAGCAVTVDGAPRVHGWWDRTRLERLVENLLANSIKFGQGKPITITVQQLGDQVRLQVTDAGIGIDPAMHDRIFERFGRAVSEEHYGGLGLGLFICRRIAESHGGSISVDSLPGAGATFTVDLPCSRATADLPVPEAASRPL